MSYVIIDRDVPKNTVGLRYVSIHPERAQSTMTLRNLLTARVTHYETEEAAEKTLAHFREWTGLGRSFKVVGVRSKTAPKKVLGGHLPEVDRQGLHGLLHNKCYAMLRPRLCEALMGQEELPDLLAQVDALLDIETGALVVPRVVREAVVRDLIRSIDEA